MKTVCHTQLSFANLDSKAVVADFEGGHITSDAGCLLLREIDQRTAAEKQRIPTTWPKESPLQVPGRPQPVPAAQHPRPHLRG